MGWKPKAKIKWFPRQEFFETFVEWRVRRIKIKKAKKLMETLPEAKRIDDTQRRYDEFIKTQNDRKQELETKLYGFLETIAHGLLRARSICSSRSNKLYYTPADEDDIVIYSITKMFSNNLLKFRSRRIKGAGGQDWRHFYAYVENGLDQHIRNVINCDRSKWKTRGAVPIPFSYMAQDTEYLDYKLCEESSIYRKETRTMKTNLMKLDLLKMLKTNRHKFWPSCQRIIDVILKRGDFTILYSNKDFYTELGYTREVKRVFLAKCAQFCACIS